jgi:hypothetical protein
VPFAVGENLRTPEEFERAVELGVCAVAQPNVGRVGGVPVDPADVWLVAQYARADSDWPPTPLWQQVVHRVSFG